MKSSLTAAVLIIGDEILSGRTRDINLQTIAEFLTPLGIPVAEARVVSDKQDQIVKALNSLRSDYTYVFTTGGIGPTHDDITAEAVAAAFCVPIGIRDDARAILVARYEETGVELTPARLRMARIPETATLIRNPVSGAPGFQIENVFVLAGVPSIVRGMLLDVEHRLQTGKVTVSGTLRCPGLREGDIADALAVIAARHDTVSVGSYPWYGGPTDSGVNIVCRGLISDDVSAIMKQIADRFVSDGISVDMSGPD